MDRWGRGSVRRVVRRTEGRNNLESWSRPSGVLPSILSERGRPDESRFTSDGCVPLPGIPRFCVPSGSVSIN